MAVNKVVMNTENGEETLIDLTSDTVTPETLAEGETAHNAAGEEITGTMKSGITEAIIDVTELPTENINEDVFYRVPKGTFCINRTPINTWQCIVVEELPSVGTVLTYDMENFVFYYEIKSGSVSGYADEGLAAASGLSEGWYPIDLVVQMLGVTWGGIFSNVSYMPSDPNTLALLFEYKIYHYKQSWITDDGSVGAVGSGLGSEIFNSPTNIATGDYSHAEGNNTIARGNVSHTEGTDTIAEGIASHAEGVDTFAKGYCAHSEGYMVVASGEASHGEGYGIKASGQYQHAQGKFNIEDAENKYAHIVGNGDALSGTRSNAHTLDWNGVGWFAGDVKVGGTGQDDENAKTLATIEYVDDLVGDISTALDELHTYAQNIVNG